MALIADFSFSQANLQDYVECPRRFQLAYVLKLPWPAVPSEPLLEQERRMRLGEAFHRLVWQAGIGLPADRIVKSAGSDPDLLRWWNSFQRHAPAGLPTQRAYETMVAATVGGYRLLAKYDFVACQPGEHTIIVDWKTGHYRPSRLTMIQRLQTRVYCYLLVEAGASLNGGQPALPEQVQMIYWYAEYPDQPHILGYSSEQYKADGDFLAGLIAEIAVRSDFPRTGNEKLCRYCHYRSYCERGKEAGALETGEAEDAFAAEEAESLLGLDFEQIAELEF